MLRALYTGSAACRASRQIRNLAHRSTAASSAAPRGLAGGAAPAQRTFSGGSASSFRAPSMAAAAGYGNVDVKGAAELVQGGQSTYADVRTAEEYAAGHPKGAVNVPVFLKQNGQMVPNPQFVQQFEAAFPDKSAPLVVGCLSGRRSLAACEQLAAAGYTSLQNVEGGFQAWSGAGLPVEA